MRYTLISKNYEEFTLLPSDIKSPSINFKGAKFACCALPGDEVSIITPQYTQDDIINENNSNSMPPDIKIERRAEYPPLIGIVDLKSKTIYGFTSKNAPIVIFYPFDERFPPFRVGCAKSRTENLLVSVRFESWDKKNNLPRGGIINYLGIAGDLRSELYALSLSRNPWPAKYEILPDASITKMHPQRTLLINHFICVNIDPEGCRDIDDAISFSQLSESSWEIAIHIADVACKVEPGDNYDKFARKNASTIYDTEGKVLRPMLPLHLSEDACSLKKDTFRPTIALVFNWDIATKTISNKRFIETLAAVNHNASYDNIDKILPSEIYQCLFQLVTYLGANAIDTHTWVEVLMILYNIEVAKIIPANYGLLRCQSSSKACSISFNHPDLKFIGLEKAKYEIKKEISTTQTHYGLGGILYTHATSPIRRYADLVNQRAIKAYIHDVPIKPHSSPQFLAYHLNLREKQIKKGEHIILFLEVLHKTKRTAVDAIIIDIDIIKQKTRLYVPEWKRFVTYKKIPEVSINSMVKLEFFFDSSQINWENKLVFKISPLI
jgi:exoribonuclease R